MSINQRTIRNLSPDFAIPPGTQVVLLDDHKAEQTDNIKKAGSVGVITRCPPHNGVPYLVRFTDETELLIRFEHLTLRRQEIENILGDVAEEDFTPYIIYRCKVGSKAFGLASDDSDDDFRGIFVPPADRHWSLYKLPEQIESKDENGDQVYWEIEKFLKLALKANPNILETLWTPVVLYADPIAEKIRTSRRAFLSSHLYKTYSGYVLSQFRRMKNAFEKTGEYKPKHAMHLVRLLYSGIAALRTGEIMIDVSQHRGRLLEIRGGSFSFEQVQKMALELDREFQAAFEETTLPDQPDFETVNALLIEARNSMVGK